MKLIEHIAVNVKSYFYNVMVLGHEDREAVNLEESVNAFMRLHSNAKKFFKRVNRCFYPYVLLWILTALPILVINVYMIITFWDGQHKVEIVKLELRIMLAIIALLYVSGIADTQPYNDDILSFLFKYPISKLTRSEAAQVEMLITTLTVQKPALRASSSLVLGTRSLATISGFILTYVLVALQFQAAWTKS